jgi:hypothetical protein
MHQIGYKNVETSQRTFNFLLTGCHIYDAATRDTTLNIPMSFSFNHLYFNCLYFNGRLFQCSYISTSGERGSSLPDTTLFECPVCERHRFAHTDERGKLALRYYIDQIPGARDCLLTLMRGGSWFCDTTLISSLCLRASVFPIVSLYIIK